MISTQSAFALPEQANTAPFDWRGAPISEPIDERLKESPVGVGQLLRAEAEIAVKAERPVGVHVGAIDVDHPLDACEQRRA